MKPTSLEPYIPLHLPLFWGPDPSAGFSYGCYQNEQKTKIVSKKQEIVFCPITGKQMGFIGDVDSVEFDGTVADIKKHSTCSSCESDIHSNFEVSSDYNCWNCGCLLKGEKQTMSKIKEIRKSIEAQISIAEEGEFISIDKLLTELDKGKESKEVAEEVKTDAEVVEVTADEKEKPETEPKAEEKEKEEKPESKEGEEGEVSEEVSEEIADQVSEEVKDQVSEEIADQVSEEVADQVSEEVSDDIIENIADEVSEQVSEEVKEHIEDTIDDINETNEEEELEDMIDLDIVLSMVNEKQISLPVEEEMISLDEVIAMASEKEMVDLETVIAMAEEAIESKKTANANKQLSEEIMKTEKEKTIARLRAKARANIIKRKVEAEASEVLVEVAPIVEVAPAIEPEFVIKEVPAADLVSSAPEAETLVATEPVVEVAPAIHEEEASEALRYETLSDLKDLQSCGKDGVEMVLFGEKTENPTWMVFQDMMPLAKVELAKQADAESIKEVFASEAYAMDLVNLCGDIGLVDCLKKVNADFFANETSDKKIEARFEERAEAKISKFKSQAEAKLRNDIMKALDVVTVGMTKNLYQDVGHPLKDALFEGMTLAGLPENTAKSVVNASFASAASAYYQVVIEKAIAFMNMNETAQSELKSMISEASVMDHEVSEADMSLTERLARSSSVASIRPYDLSVRPNIEINKDAYKAKLKASMRK